MSWLLQNLKGAIAALYDSVESSTVQLFTVPAQLSSGHVLGSSAVVAVLLWTGLDSQERGINLIKKVKLREYFTSGTVYVHVARPFKLIPNLTPFGFKLETYLRMTGIPYEVIDGVDYGPKNKAELLFAPNSYPHGKIPWIEYNGEAMGDSGLIIEFLNKEKGVDLNKNLSDTDKAVSRAFTKMVEENTYWGLQQERMIEDSGRLYLLLKLPFYLKFYHGHGKWFIRNKVKKMMWAHGIGRHSKDELEGIMEKDLKALSTFLGTKPYLMGEEPTEIDAAVFGQLSQLVWVVRNPDCYLHRIVTKDCPNLQAYCVRMKERYWPDWDQLTGNTK